MTIARPPSLLIFDCDGVLVDSEVLQTRVLLELASELGFSTPLADAVQEFRGKPIARCVQVIEEKLEKPVPSGFVQAFREGCARVFAAELQPIDGIREVLAELSGPRCVASNGPTEKIRYSLEVTGLLERFGDRIFSSYEIGSWKPEPDLFLYAAARMGAPAAECTVVEDSVVGVQAGVGAGMRVLGFATGSRAEALASAGAEVFANMRELTRLIGAHV